MDGEDYFDEMDCLSYPLDVDDLLEKNQHLRRRICALGWKYTIAFQELKKAREALGCYERTLLLNTRYTL